MDGRRAVIDAVCEGLTETYGHFLLPDAAADRERIGLAMGLPASMFFRVAFDPDTVPVDLHDVFASEFELRSTRAEVAALHRGESALYDGAEATLAALAERGHPMALFSNASEPYFRAVIQVHRLERFFTRTLSLEQAVRRRIARHKPGMVRYLSRGFAHAVVVGDRIHDIEAGRAAGARTVGCLYGFGGAAELEQADFHIEHAPQLLALPLATSPIKGRSGQVDAAQERA
jgi:phosphoglycolate phosphatase-like HAD superfamily hydrolase